MCLPVIKLYSYLLNNYEFFFSQFLQNTFQRAATNASVDVRTMVTTKCTSYLLFIKWDYVQLRIPTWVSHARFSEKLISILITHMITKQPGVEPDYTTGGGEIPLWLFASISV